MTFKNTQAKNSLKTLNTLEYVELKKQAAGLNTIDVYVPWNLHEPRRGEFDFGRQVSLIFLTCDNLLPLRLGQLPILAISQPHSLPWAGQAAGHARHPQVISRQRVADFELGRASDQAENMKTVYGLTDWFYITNV